MSEIYPFRPSALAKQAASPAMEEQPGRYPFREQCKPAKYLSVVEEKDTSAGIFLLATAIGALCVVMAFVVELAFPGWTVGMGCFMAR